MREYTPAGINALNQDHVKVVVLVEVAFPLDIYRFNSFTSNLAWNNDVYSGTGDLLRVSTIYEMPDLKPHEIQVSLSSVNTSITNNLFSAQQLEMVEVTIWHAILGDDGLLFDGQQMFYGRLSKVVISSEGVVTGRVESVFHDWFTKTGNLYSNEAQQFKYPGDLFFSNMAGLAVQSFNWGGLASQNTSSGATHDHVVDP